MVDWRYFGLGAGTVVLVLGAAWGPLVLASRTDLGGLGVALTLFCALGAALLAREFGRMQALREMRASAPNEQP